MNKTRIKNILLLKKGLSNLKIWFIESKKVRTNTSLAYKKRGHTYTSHNHFIIKQTYVITFGVAYC